MYISTTMAQHNVIGSRGEDYVVEYLEKQGYIILERDWRYGRNKSDVDIICKTADRKTVVFVEVKTRSSVEMATPEDAIDIKKIRRIGRLADDYVKMHDIVEELRFDFIGLVIHKDNPDIELNHIEDAFNPLLV